MGHSPSSHFTGPERNINRRIAIAAFCIGVVVMLCIGTVKGMVSSHRAEIQYKQTIDVLSNGYLSVIEAALWIRDDRAIEQQIAALVSDIHISYTAVIENGGILLEAGTPNPAATIRRSFPIVHESSNRVQQIGTFEIHGNEAYLQEVLWSWLYRDLPFEGIGFLLVGIFIFFYVDFQITSKITTIIQRLNTYDLSTKDLPFPDINISPIDEIDYLKLAFNRFAKTLIDTLSHLRKEERLAQKNYDKYLTLFSMAPIPLLLADYSAVYQHLVAGFEDTPSEKESINMARKYIDLLSVSAVNKAMLDLAEASSTEEFTDRFQSIICGDNCSTFYDHFKNILRGEKQFQMELDIRTLLGELKQVQINWLVLEDSHDLPYSHVIIVMVDLSSRVQGEIALAEKVREREVLIRELFHRTKNNMQNILSFISLESWRIEDESLRDILHSLETRIYSMSLVHRMLYEYSDLSCLSLSAYLREYTAYLTASENIEERGIRLDLILEEIVVTIDIAIPIGLITTELISNSLKHAFPDRKPGVITIELEQLSYGDIALTITDNGIGTDSSFDPMAVDSIGMQLIESLTESQLGGSVSFESSPGQGFRCKVIARPDLYAPRI